MDSLVFAILCAVGFVIFMICLKIATMRINKKRIAEGKEPIPEEEYVHVIDITRRR